MSIKVMPTQLHPVVWEFVYSSTFNKIISFHSRRWTYMAGFVGECVNVTAKNTQFHHQNSNKKSTSSSSKMRLGKSFNDTIELKAFLTSIIIDIGSWSSVYYYCYAMQDVVVVIFSFILRVHFLCYMHFRFWLEWQDGVLSQWLLYYKIVI